MTYDDQILKILSEVGPQGISVRFLAKHVYNLNCTLFSTPDKADIHRYVQQFLTRNSRSPQSLIESTGQRGYYRLNTGNSADARQLMFEFKQTSESEDDNDNEEQNSTSQDLSLSLFD